MASQTGLIPMLTGSTAYSPVDLQADPVLRDPRVACSGALSLAVTFRPYRFGMSRPDLRPTITDK